jgi:hypothetical protein
VHDFAHLEAKREQAISLMREIYTAVENGVSRERDRRKYRSQCMYFYHLYRLGDAKSPYQECDYYELDAGLSDLILLKKKLRMFWFYKERKHLSYEEAVQEHLQRETSDCPKFRPKKVPLGFGA